MMYVIAVVGVLAELIVALLMVLDKVKAYRSVFVICLVCTLAFMVASYLLGY